MKYKESVIQVNRGIKPKYPDFIKELVNPEKEREGPAEWDFESDTKPWLIDKQTKMPGDEFCDHGGHTGDPVETVDTSFNLQDGLAIQARGSYFFRKFIGEKPLLLTGTMARDFDGRIIFPFLYLDDNIVYINWGIAVGTAVS